MKKEVVGSVWFAERFDSLVVQWIALWIVTTGVLYIIRLLTEGKLYDASRSSMPGDIFLALHCSIAAMLWRDELPQNGIHMYPAWHMSIGILAFSAGTIWHVINLMSKEADNVRFNMLPAQWYHDIVVIPLFAYMILSMSPILLEVFKKRTPEVTLAGVCLVVWVALLVLDQKSGNFIKLRDQAFRGA